MSPATSDNEQFPSSTLWEGNTNIDLASFDKSVWKCPQTSLMLTSSITHSMQTHRILDYFCVVLPTKPKFCLTIRISVKTFGLSQAREQYSRLCFSEICITYWLQNQSLNHLYLWSQMKSNTNLKRDQASTV